MRSSTTSCRTCPINAIDFSFGNSVFTPLVGSEPQIASYTTSINADCAQLVLDCIKCNNEVLKYMIVYSNGAFFIDDVTPMPFECDTTTQMWQNRNATGGRQTVTNFMCFSQKNIECEYSPLSSAQLSSEETIPDAPIAFPMRSSASLHTIVAKQMATSRAKGTTKSTTKPLSIANKRGGSSQQHMLHQNQSLLVEQMSQNPPFELLFRMQLE